MRNLRKKFRRPKKPWSMELMAEFNALKSEYGLRNTKDILASMEKLRRFRRRAKQLIAMSDEKEKSVLVGKLAKLGMLKPDAGLDDVLALGVKSLLDRRLQTVVFRKGMASSIGQARQMIVHGKISVCGRRIKFPSYIVAADEEGSIGWHKGKPKPSEGPKKLQKHAQEEGIEPASEGDSSGMGQEDE